MLAEKALRRREFRSGMTARLADGQPWVLPGPPPPGVGGEGDPSRGDYAGLMTMLLEAEDHDERLLAELALGIFLLGCNYDLGPAQYAALLECSDDRATLEALQRAFHLVAQEHFRQFNPDPADDRSTASPGQLALSRTRRLAGLVR